MQCEDVIGVYGVLVFPLVALTRRVVASRLCGGTLGEGREIEVLHATVCVINLYKRDGNFYFLLETSYSCVCNLCYIASALCMIYIFVFFMFI